MSRDNVASHVVALLSDLVVFRDVVKSRVSCFLFLLRLK